MKFEVHANGIKMQVEIDIPRKKPEFVGNMMEQRNKRRAWICDVIGAYAVIIIAALKKKLNQCKLDFLANSTNAYQVGDSKVIEWVNKEGHRDTFSIISNDIMTEAIHDLEHSAWLKFALNKTKVSQAIEALLEQNNDRSDQNGFRFKDLSKCLNELLQCKEEGSDGDIDKSEMRTGEYKLEA